MHLNSKETITVETALILAIKSIQAVCPEMKSHPAYKNMIRLHQKVREGNSL